MPGWKEPDPLAIHPKYEMVKRIKDAMYGFVVLARNKESQELVAVRFFDNRLRKGQWIPLEDKGAVNVREPACCSINCLPSSAYVGC